MIRNLIDRRKRPYRWKRINAIIEATEHDNTCTDADEAPESDPMVVVDHDHREGLSIEEAVTWAHQVRCHVTLYLYDEGAGTKGEEHFVEVSNRF